MSRRPLPQSAEAAGQDSFLDVVANTVGILIILIMVVGARASQVVVNAPPAETSRADQEALLAAQGEALSLQGEVQELDQQTKQMKMAIAARRAQQEQLATLIEAVKQELANHRNQLSSESQQQYDLRRSLAEAESQLEALDRRQIALDSMQPASTIEVQSLPTPISKTVHGRELHFQLRNGRLTFIPLDPLLDKFKADAPNKIWKFKNQPIVADTVGPIDGFRLRYELEQTGAIVRLIRWELLPVSEDLGDTIETSLGDGSYLRSLLARIDRANTTLTIWTYPDSFQEFRALKADLHARGYACAGRPLPMNQPIGGSPEGSRSASQ